MPIPFRSNSWKLKINRCIQCPKQIKPVLPCNWTGNKAKLQCIKKPSVLYTEGFFYLEIYCYTLKRKCITSPSLTIYSFPSTRSFPASLTFASEPYVSKSVKAITSARIKPFSKSEWMTPAA